MNWYIRNMQYQVSNYYDDSIDYDVSLVELTDEDKENLTDI